MPSNCVCSACGKDPDVGETLEKVAAGMLTR